MKIIRVTFSILITIAISACSIIEDKALRTASEKEDKRKSYLRGAITPEREWWDLKHYNLSIEFFPETRKLKGSNVITYEVLKNGTRMQIDLQPPLTISKVIHNEKELAFDTEGNVNWITFAEAPIPGTEGSIEVFYEGRPKASKNPPWSGGISWDRDDLGEHYIVTTSQGIGASIFWPNKDHGYDEPDRGINLNVTVPDNLVAVSNGRLKNKTDNKISKTSTYNWQVTNPINNYAVNINIGNYVHFTDEYEGESGPLSLDYWVLEHQLDVAKEQFKEVPRMLQAFEYWFGPYPFYDDGYKLVSVPYPGMEHQSSVTYGNWFRNGYRGRDTSNTGVGFKFDFIIIHESGHEWFGNNITSKDIADLWIHESFTNYSENLFVEYHFSEKEAQDYVVGCRNRIENKLPIIGTYNEHKAGSYVDVYDKGGNMLHTIRHVIKNDQKWRSILRGLNEYFRHQTVDSKQVENYIIESSGVDLAKVFDQYLRTTDVPNFNYHIDGSQLIYNYQNVVDGFNMPLTVSINHKKVTLSPTEATQKLILDEVITDVSVDRNFYVSTSVY